MNMESRIVTMRKTKMLYEDGSTSRWTICWQFSPAEDEEKLILLEWME